MCVKATIRVAGIGKCSALWLRLKCLSVGEWLIEFHHLTEASAPDTRRDKQSRAAATTQSRDAIVTPFSGKRARGPVRFFSF